MKCINCGKDCANTVDTGFMGFKICQACDDVGNQMADFLNNGIKLEYSDGTTEVLKNRCKKDFGVE